jgi:hypothetical protein
MKPVTRYCRLSSRRFLPALAVAGKGAPVMMSFFSSPRFARILLMTVAIFVVMASYFVASAADKKPDGTISIEQFSVAFIGSAQFGSGNLNYQGKRYDFKISGLGIGGIGVSTIDADGYVYELKNLADFPGVYGQARTGITFGTVGKGQLWLENGNGVYLHLKAKRQGLALALGADGMIIQMK